MARAEELRGQFSQSAGLLDFYRSVLKFQSGIFTALARSGDTDVASLTRYRPDLIRLVEREGPPQLLDFARMHLPTAGAHEDLLRRCWETDELKGPGPEEPAKFFARALLQPFAEYLASRGKPEGGEAASKCPFCGARPVAGVLRSEGDGAKRSLLCSLCATEWPFRRILCPNCGEEDKEQLPFFESGEFDLVRLEACDTCKTYIKTVSLAKNGHAVPMVDELAAPALAIWADEMGYSRLETNILGM
jgi:FdhE protein